MSILTSLATAVIAAAMLASCEDNSLATLDYTRSGEKVTLKVALTLPEMETKTRASLNANSLNQVNNIWVRTYSSETGKATSEWVIKENLTSTSTEQSNSVTIETESGSSYIVAVANVDNMGVTSNTINNPVPLKDLLKGAETWKDFLDIAVVSPSNLNDVYAPTPPLPMAGCYTDLVVGGTHPEPSRIDEWQKKDFTPYFIPASGSKMTLDGAIHLRRLVSHLTFNFIPGNDISLTVNSYQVMNAPKFSWLYERPAANGMLTNFGDKASDENVMNFYADVPLFTSQYVTKTDDGKNSFDFWQAENKHTGTSSTYAERDKKSGTLFTSLTGTTWTPNNEASYVLVSCTVDYKDKIKVNDKGEVTTDGTEVYRSGEAVYLIHLGYMNLPEENQSALTDAEKREIEVKKSKDFNCFRNVDYTYDVTVNGLTDIRLDAYATDETYHGEEGVVSDLSNATIELDAHYHAFNIKLDQTELTKDFSYIITTYDNGEQITITEVDNASAFDSKYYNWIELRPTTGKFVLAEYKPRCAAFAKDEKITFLLTDLKGGWEAMTDGMRSASGYYTVFVNEYTYEPMYTGTDGYANEQNTTTGKPNWMSYVNQNPRRFYIKVTQHESPDKNSIYMRSKYGISQTSIQTYYSTENITPSSGSIASTGTAIGIERFNETEGLNICRPGDYGTDTSNGRYNAAQWLSKSNTNIKLNSSAITDKPLWSDFVNQKAPMEIPAVTGVRAQNGPDLPDRTGADCVKLPALVAPITNRDATFNDPQSDNTYSIDVYNACMSRNRDNNGNGRIDAEELRWYIPAMGKYLRLLIGAPSLSNPLMKFADISKLPRVNSEKNGWNESATSTSDYINNDYLSRYMYSTSDGARVLWAMEGMSTSTWAQVSGDWSNNASRPWQIRCIRNLGTNLNTVSPDEKVVMAYIVDDINRTVEFKYFDPKGIRVNKLNGNGAVGNTSAAMPIHNNVSDFNKPYRKFEYYTTDITVPSTNKSLAGLGPYITENNPCNIFGSGWRVPNQTELAILLNLRKLTGNGSYLSCTYNYFNQYTGSGGGYTNGKNLFLGILGSGYYYGNRGTMMNESNLSLNMFVRCVRDVD